MIPVGGIIGALVLAQRWSQRNRPAVPALLYGRGTSPVNLRAVFWLLELVLLVPTAVVALADGPRAVVPALVSAAVLAVPLVPLVRWVLVPLGAVRTAAVLGRVGALGPALHPVDRRQWSALLGAWALVHRRTHEPRRAAWVQARLDAAIAADGTRAVGLACSALLAASRGDGEAARRLFLAVLELPEALVPRPVRGLVLRWLVADAAERAVWHPFLAESVRWKPRGLLRFARAVAEAEAPGPPARGRLVVAWLLAGPRLRLLPVLRAALRPRPPEPAEPELLAGLPGADAVERALAAHAALSGSTGPRTVVRAAEAWRQVFDVPELAARVPPGVRGEVVSALLAALEARQVQVRAVGVPGLLGELADRQREQLLDAVEQRVHGHVERVDGGTLLPIADEWVAWDGLARAFARLDEADAQTCFAVMGSRMTHVAATLYNQRAERTLAHAMFRWLAAQAARLGFEELRQINEKNARCAP